MIFVFGSILDQYKIQKICDIVVSLYPFLIVYCPDKYKTQRMCDKAVDDSLAALKLTPDWFVTRKIIKTFILLCTYMMVYSFLMKILEILVRFCCNEMGIFTVNLNNINLDNHFVENDPDTIILIRLLAWHSKFEKRRTLKKI